jgi:ribosomal protein S18 acetylase RimI-like enzyme
LKRLPPGPDPLYNAPVVSLAPGCQPEVIQLGRVRAADLEDLLAEETHVWQRDLEWDFVPTAQLVRRYVEMESLAGFALAAQGQVVGYTYFVWEEHKGLVGDLYVMEAFRAHDSEGRLLAAVLTALRRQRHVRRVESQLMLLEAALDRPLPEAAHLRRFERQLMVIDREKMAQLRPRSAADVAFHPWDARYQDEAACVIAGAYRGHIDSEINDQYRSIAGARRFLRNVIQFPGCGTFFAPASWLAVDSRSSQLCGICLTSLVADDVGHITQICVLPEARGRGVGYELLRRSLVTLAQAGVSKASLTVTTANRRAVELYESVGFRVRRRFAALVWDGL